MSPSRKILFLTTSLCFAGAETQVYRLALTLKQRGWSVLVVTMLDPVAYVQELAASGVAVVSLGMTRGSADVGALLRLARLIRRERPDVVHAHMVHANLLSRVTRWLAPIPVLVNTAHNIDEGGRHRDWWYRLTDALVDMTTQVSEAGARRYLSRKMVSPRKIRFLPNGIDTSAFRRDASARDRARTSLGVAERFVWLAVGRFEEAKDYPSLIGALAQLPATDPSSVVLLVGDGPLRPAMEARVREAGLADRARFLGIRKDVPALMNAADAYVMSSAWEGMPMVLLEAAASELPVVATDVGGNAETMEAGVSGVLVPPGDPRKLADAMQALMAMPAEDRSRMGTAGRRFVAERYELRTVVDGWEALYAELSRGPAPEVSGDGGDTVAAPDP